VSCGATNTNVVYLKGGASALAVKGQPREGFFSVENVDGNLKILISMDGAETETIDPVEGAGKFDTLAFCCYGGNPAEIVFTQMKVTISR
jgi:hypothetical protein